MSYGTMEALSQGHTWGCDLNFEKELVKSGTGKELVSNLFTSASWLMNSIIDSSQGLNKYLLNDA